MKRKTAQAIANLQPRLTIRDLSAHYGMFDPPKETPKQPSVTKNAEK